MIDPDAFLKFATEKGAPLYIRARSIHGFGPSTYPNEPTTLFVDGMSVHVSESVEAVLDAITDSLTGNIVEVEQAA